MQKIISESEQILGFNPYSKEYDSFVTNITPEMAEYILENHNFDNRTISEANTRAIKKSVVAHGWLSDGNPMIFATSGNLTEAQHRLRNIVQLDITVPMVVVVGADPESFTKTEPGKRRTERDIISRRDKSVTSEQVTILKQLLKRRAGYGATKKGCPTLNQRNCLEQWYKWKDYIIQGQELTNDFFDGTVTQFDPWERQIRAWATLMVFNQYSDVVTPFLEALKEGLLFPGSSPLVDGIDKFMTSKDIAYLAGEKKAAKVHFMLCHATDRFINADMSDRTQFAGDVETVSHDRLSKYGIYRSFLQNPLGLKVV